MMVSITLPALKNTDIFFFGFYACFQCRFMLFGSHVTIPGNTTMITRAETIIKINGSTLRKMIFISVSGLSDFK